MILDLVLGQNQEIIVKNSVVVFKRKLKNIEMTDYLLSLAKRLN